MAVDEREHVGLRMSARPTDRLSHLTRWLVGDDAGTLAAAACVLLCLSIYVVTLLPGVSIGDAAEFQRVPYALEVPHPTGFPTYVLLAHVFELLPAGSVAWRANLFSAVAGALSGGVAVLTMRRLGVGSLAAFAAATAASLSAIIWAQATVAEVSTLLLLLMLLFVHRAVVWRDTQRARDLLPAAFLLGLAMGVHLLAVGLAPFGLLYAGWAGRRALRARPALVAASALALAAGLSVYLYLPVQALLAPSVFNARFLTWDGFAAWVTGANSQGQMHFLSLAGIAMALSRLPAMLALVVRDTHPLLFALAAGGFLACLRRAPAFALFSGALVGASLYLTTDFLGYDRYLLVAMAMAGIWVGVALDTAARLLARARPLLGSTVPVVGLALPLLLAQAHWSAMATQPTSDGRALSARVFALLPPHAALETYWDTLQPFLYEQCVEGVRPDVEAFYPFNDDYSTCEPTANATEPLASRPTYVLMWASSWIPAFPTGFTLEPVAEISIPYGHTWDKRTLYRVVRVTAGTPHGGAPLVSY